MLSASIVNAASPLNEQDAIGNLRLTSIVAMIILRVRGAVATGGRNSVSLTAASVPPETEYFTYVLIANAMMVAMPQMAQFVESDTWEAQVETAEDFIKEVSRGSPIISEPSDPDPATTPIGLKWGDINGTAAAATAGKIDLLSM